ncbi:hypothetical protein Tco_1460716, partial [Tanacetum coccineum]
MQPYDKIDINAPFLMAFEAVGWKWAKYVVAVGALKGMTFVLLVGAIGQASCWVEMGKICGGCRSFKGYDFCTSSWGRWSSKPYDKININAPFSMAFEAVEWKWKKYVVAIGALKGMTSVLLVGAVGQA